MKNPIPPVSAREVVQDSTLPWINKEAIPVLRVLKKRADAAPSVVTLSYDSDGAGTYLTLWSETIPTDRTWFVTAQVLGRVAAHNAAYQISGLFKNDSGTSAQVGATASVVSIESDAACDARFSLSGSVLSVQARDDGSHVMTWKAIVEVFPTDE